MVVGFVCVSKDLNLGNNLNNCHERRFNKLNWI